MLSGQITKRMGVDAIEYLLTYTDLTEEFKALLQRNVRIIKEHDNKIFNEEQWVLCSLLPDSTPTVKS
jgi:hypothetical protein